MLGLSEIQLPTVEPRPVTHCTAPGVTPASTRSPMSFKTVSGLEVAGFTTMALPAISAGPALNAQRAAGKLKGTMQAMTPSGSCTVTWRSSS